MGEVMRGRRLVAEGNFPELTLEVGRRLHLDGDVVVPEWTCDYGDGRLYRNVTIAELRDGEAVRVTNYWGEPTFHSRLAPGSHGPPGHARRRDLEGSPASQHH